MFYYHDWNYESYHLIINANRLQKIIYKCMIVKHYNEWWIEIVQFYWLSMRQGPEIIHFYSLSLSQSPWVDGGLLTKTHRNILSEFVISIKVHTR